MGQTYDIASEDARSFTRMKPAVYCGDTGNPNQLMVEYFSNAVDEHVIGNGNVISMTFRANGEWVIKDEGQGIPTNQFRRKVSSDEQEQYETGKLIPDGVNYFVENETLYAKDDKSTLERSFSVINSSGKYSEDGVYNGTSLGAFGIGSKLGNWLSNKLVVVSCREGDCEKLEFEEGKLVSREQKQISTNIHGVSILFKPSSAFFNSTELDEPSFLKLITDTAYLCPNLTINYTNEITGNEYSISKNGLTQWLDDLKMTEIIKNRIMVKYDKKETKQKMDMIITYCDSYTGTIVPYVNYGLTETGTHITAVKECITRTLNKFARDKMMLKEGDKNLTGDQLQEGMYCIFNLVTPNVKYDAQVKTRVTNRDLSPFITEAMQNTLEFWLSKNDKEARKIIDKAIAARKAQEAAKRARDKARGESKGKMLVKYNNKLSDCTSNDPAECEVYIVEGDSAGGSAKTARNRRNQAILSLRGKILNVDKADEKKIMANNEIRTMIASFGCGIGTDFNVDKLKYDKIIILTDADVDGAHISTLLLTFFYRFMPELITSGHIYRAMPPLYSVKTVKGTTYLQTDADLEAYQEANKGKRYVVSRYKGLGEMDAEQLWDTTLNPENRVLKRITMSDCEEELKEVEELFSTLMGTDVSKRKQFIIDNSYLARVDI